MKRIVRWGGPLAALLTFFAAGVLGAPAAQAATCSGSSCFGKDPQASGCNTGTKTLATIGATGSIDSGELTSNITAELRWTGSCGHVAWLRTSYMPNAGPVPIFKVESCGGAKCVDHHVIQSPTDYPWPHCSKDPNGSGICFGPFWTDMVPTANTLVRICGAATQSHYGAPTTHGPWGCSAWY